MQIIKLLLSIFLLSVLFTACSSKVQTQVVNSNKEDVSDPLKKLITKEKEINKLNQKLEDCPEK